MRGIVRVLSAGILSAGAWGTLTLSSAPSAGATPGPAAAPGHSAAATGSPVPVIVFLSYQPPSAVGQPADLTQRTQEIDAAQAPYLSLLRQLHATDIKTYTLVNAFAATLPAAAATMLAGAPGVAQVIPDSPIDGPAAPSALAGTPSGRNQQRCDHGHIVDRIAGAARRLSREGDRTRAGRAGAHAHRLADQGDGDRPVAWLHRSGRHRRVPRRRARPVQREPDARPQVRRRRLPGFQRRRDHGAHRGRRSVRRCQRDRRAGQPRLPDAGVQRPVAGHGVRHPHRGHRTRGLARRAQGVQPRRRRPAPPGSCRPSTTRSPRTG